MDWLRESIIANLLTEFIIVVGGVLFAYTIQKWWKERRYGGWHAYIFDEKGTQVLDRTLSAQLAERVIKDDHEKSLFLKSLASTYAEVNCDLPTEGDKRGVYSQDNQARRMELRIKPPDIVARASKSPHH